MIHATIFESFAQPHKTNNFVIPAKAGMAIREVAQRSLFFGQTNG
jgi:hypothetical protein